ncbi:TetR family transcriptional regulator [Limobrevibacterium gyesilva]|uniref:TetR family transcriptional regulator n=1 Tax=Limobrevibacterium gyesilva TaxID=2991712 RepID=A0AA41YV93_9PROT|nr:TetR family transcriptional regulator [Limobrevibacterium gyesilva]MCW3476022.1 TetR family transcriptional regulator [Limobrevibacterium gyesilva]
MDDTEFDRALIAAAFEVAAQRGWHRMRVADAARHAALPLDRARARFPGRGVVLIRFGRLADQNALAGVIAEGPVRDRLFDILMRRIDVLQAHRPGVLALLQALPCDPPLALMLAAANLCSMGWMLDGAGIPATGPRGRLRTKGLLGVWLWTVRAWRHDESLDLAATMAALDHALARAEHAESWLHPRRPPARAPRPHEAPVAEGEAPEPPAPAPPAPEPPPTEPSSEPPLGPPPDVS